VLGGGTPSFHLQLLPPRYVCRLPTLLCCSPLIQFRALLPNTLIVLAFYLGCSSALRIFFLLSWIIVWHWYHSYVIGCPD
jgi:hypothetical protein